MIAKKNCNKVHFIIGGVILLLGYYCFALGDGGENVIITNEVLHEIGMLAPVFAIILLLIVELLVIRNGLIIDAHYKRVEEKRISNIKYCDRLNQQTCFKFTGFFNVYKIKF